MAPKRMSRRAPPNPFHYPRGGGNPMGPMVRDINRTALGIVGIGAITTLGMGTLGALKK